jgi:polyhydroxyalkanoate synthase
MTDLFTGPQVAMDEMRFPRKLYEEVIEILYRKNRFMSATIMDQGNHAAPKSIALPILSVVDPQSKVVPPQLILPFHDAVRSRYKRVIWHRGDVEVALQYVGVIVGKHAHVEVGPEILQ